MRGLAGLHRGGVLMGSFLVLVESVNVTVISDPGAFAKAAGAGVTAVALQRLPTGHYLELEDGPSQDPEHCGPLHRTVIRLARPSLPRGGRAWPIRCEPVPDSLEGLLALAAAKVSEAEGEKALMAKADTQTPTDVDESEVRW